MGMPGLPKNKRVLSPTFLFPGVAIVLIASGFLVYYFPFTARQESILDALAFRSLNSVADQLEKTTANYASAVAQASKTQDPWAFLDTQVSGLDAVQNCGQRPGGIPGAEPLTVRKHSERGRYHLRVRFHGGADICGQFALEDVIARLLRAVPKDLFDAVAVTDKDGEVLSQSGGSGLRLVRLDAVLPSAASAKERGGDREPGAQTFSSASLSSRLSHMQLAGSEYRVYIVPVRLPLLDEEAGKESARLAISGFIHRARFQKQIRSIPGNLVWGGLVAVLFVVVGTWPLLSFTKMRGTERIPRRTGLYYVLSMMMAVALGILLALHLAYVSDYESTEEQLTRLAAGIDDHLGSELDQALKTMDALMRTAQYDSAPIRRIKSADEPLPNYCTDLLTSPELAGALARYPYLDQVLWTDEQGFQQMKWTVQKRVKPQTQMTAYTHFQETARGSLWRLHDRGAYSGRFRLDSEYSPNTGEALAFISVPVSRQPAFPGKVKPPAICRFSPAEPGAVGGPALAQAKTVTPLLSLTQPVLPAGFGFAVVDTERDGLVLFHSLDAKNLRENFFDETGERGKIRAAATAGRPVFLNAMYLGRLHRLLAKPIQSIEGSPLSLIVFRDLSTPDTQHLHTVVLSAVLTISFYALLMMIGMMFIRLPDYPPAWTWPRESRRAHYRHVIVSLAVVCYGFYRLIFEATDAELLATVAVIPVISLFLVVYKLRGKNHFVLLGSVVLLCLLALATYYTGPKSSVHAYRYISIVSLISGAFVFLSLRSVTQWFRRLERFPLLSRLGMRNEFALAGTCLLVVVAVLPCVAFYKLSRDFQENVFTRESELLVQQAIERREARVKEWYSKVDLAGNADTESARLIRWLFLWRRLNSQALDRYEAVFLSSRPGQRFYYRTHEGHHEGGGAPEARVSGPPARIENTLPRPLIWIAERLPLEGSPLPRLLARSASHGRGWMWTLDGTNRLRMRESTEQDSLSDTPETAGLPKFLSGDPAYHLHDVVSELRPLPDGGGRAALALVALGAILFTLIRLTVDRLFLLSYQGGKSWPAMPADPSAPLPAKLILIGLPLSGKTNWLTQRSDVHVVNMPEYLSGDPAKFDLTAAAQKDIVALDHFEYRFFNRETRLRDLELLEKLVFTLKKNVVIITSVDPVFHVEAAGRSASGEDLAPGHDLDRWAKILAGFEIRRLPGSRDDPPRSYYPLLWATCTRLEKVALYQIAKDGWANYRNDLALEHLRKRGLIRRCPAFEINPPAFRDYIRDGVAGEERAQWLQQEGTSVWDGLRATLVILLGGILGAVLFLNDKEWLGALTSIVTVMGPVTKLVSGLRGTSSGAAALPGEEAA